MFLIKLLRFFLGYVSFSVKGDFPERFLNLITRSKLRIWDAKKKNGMLCGYIIAKDYRHIRTFARKSRVRVRVTKRYGFPFFIRRYKKRVGFFCGMAVYALILFALSLSIWSIEISGNSLVSDREIEEVLKENGLSLGVYSKNLNDIEISQKTVMQIDELSYVTIFIRGSVAEVQVQEKTSLDKTDDTPCNIVAKCKGKIVSVDAYSGTAAVSKGDIVSEGDILISGIEENSISNHLVAAKGDVIAESEHNISVSVAEGDKQLFLDKSPYRRRRLNFFSLKIPLFVGRLPSGEYRVFKEDGLFTLFGRKLPVGFDTEHHYLLSEGRLADKTDRDKLCRAILLLREMSKFKKGDIVSEKISIADSKKECVITKHYICRENIGRQIGIQVENSVKN